MSNVEKVRGVAARVALALMGLPAPRRLRLDLVPTPLGIRVVPVSTPVLAAVDSVSAPEPASEPMLALPPPTPLRVVAARPSTDLLRAADAALVQRSAADHALALHDQMQASLYPDRGADQGVKRVDMGVLKQVYADLLIAHGWAEQPWNLVSEELSRILGCGKKYRNGRKSEGEKPKVRVFHFGPRIYALDETFDFELQEAA